MAPLNVNVAIKNGLRSLVFHNDFTKFSIDGFDPMDYYEAFLACKSGNNYNGEIINVHNGIVSIYFNKCGCLENNIIIYISSSDCVDAFINAYNILSDD